METTCKQCQFFIQHYGFGERRFFPLNCGHCTFARPKRKRPDTKSCEHFLPGTVDADRFVTKEYLTKQLLHYVLSLDLLPEQASPEDLPLFANGTEENPERNTKSY